MGYIAFLWPALVFVVLVSLLPHSVQILLCTMIIVSVLVYRVMPTPPVIKREDVRFMTPPRLTFLGKLLNMILTPMDFFRIGWRNKRPIRLSVLKQQASAHAKLPPNFGSDDVNSSAMDDRCVFF